MRLRIAAALAALCVLGQPALAADNSCFAAALPADIRDYRLDDAKLLIGWVFDAATAHRAVQLGDVIDRRSGISQVPGFAGATSMETLKGRYGVMRAPFDLGHGYFGILLGAVEPDGRISSMFLVNRLFRLPDVLH